MKRRSRNSINFPPQIEEEIALYKSLTGISTNELTRTAVGKFLKEELAMYRQREMEKVLLSREGKRDAYSENPV